jgi:cell division protein FtsB
LILFAGEDLLVARWILSALAILGLVMQASLWLSDNGYRKTRELRRAVSEQRQQNQSLRERNAALEAEVLNLKNGREAAEERARTDLGLIGRKETFYQVVPASDTPTPE